MAADGVPPWGSPDGENPDEATPHGGTANGGTPDYGTPPAAPVRYGQHGRGRGNAPVPPSPEPAATTWGSPGAGPDLLSAAIVVVAERGGFLSSGGYDLLTERD